MATYSDKLQTTKHDEFLNERIGQKIGISLVGGGFCSGTLLRLDDLCLIVNHPVEQGDCGKPYEELVYRHNITSIR